MKIRRFFIIYVLIAVQAFNVHSFGLHRFHTTLTRIDYNAQEKLFEISIQMFTHDLETLVKKRNPKAIDLEKTDEIDKFIFSYVKENFVLTDKKGETESLKWVGKEIDADAVRIYLETESAENLDGYKLKNTLFFESYPEQANIVVCRYEGKKADLLFKVGDKIKEILENKA